MRSASGVEGHDSCFQLFSNSTGAPTVFWQAEADCVSRGGHLLTTRQSTKRQGGLLDAVFDVFPGKDMYLGAYRWVAHLHPCLFFSMCMTHTLVSAARAMPWWQGAV